MKKTILFLTLLTLKTTIFSQYYQFQMNYSMYSISNNLEYGNSVEDKKVIQYRIDHKIKERKSIDVLKKGKIDKNPAIETYNQAGRIISVKSKNYHFTTTYLNDTIVTQSRSIYKKDTTENIYEYDKWNKLKGYKSFRNGKIISELIITKNEAGIVTNRLNKFGKNLKHSSEMKYYLDADNKLTKSERYVNGKLKNVWNYDCKPEGEIVPNKKIDEKSVCKWNENSSNGSYIIYNRTTDKEKTYLHKSYFTKDSVFYKSEQFLNDTIKVYESEKNDFKSIYKTFSEKGKLRFETIQLYNEMKLLTSNYNIRYTLRKSIVSERNYSYNNQNLIATSNFFHNRKMNSQSKFEYTFFE